MDKLTVRCARKLSYYSIHFKISRYVNSGRVDIILELQKFVFNFYQHLFEQMAKIKPRYDQASTLNFNFFNLSPNFKLS